jgi:hypothetical protein
MPVARKYMVFEKSLKVGFNALIFLTKTNARASLERDENKRLSLI